LALLISLGSLLSESACAFVDPPVLVPLNPQAGQQVSVSIRSGGCDAFTSDQPVVTRTGNAIRIDLESVSTVNPSCILPVGTTIFPVGVFDPGNYTLQVDRSYIGRNGPTTDTLAIIPLKVSAVALVPMLTRLGSAVLLAMLAALGLHRVLPRNRCAPS